MAECTSCRGDFPLPSLAITAHGYRCDGCARQAVLDGGPKGDLDNVKVGRGRWWIMPIVIAAGAAFTIAFPQYVIFAILVVVALAAMLLRGLAWRRLFG
jgi:hypothetical protein